MCNNKVYCISRCDTVSSFLGCGKKTVYRLMSQKGDQMINLSSIGTSDNLTQEHVDAARVFVGLMYGNTNCLSLDLLRSEKATKKVRPKKLPPTEDAFKLHLQRCLLQLYVWQHAHQAMHPTLSPLDYGYEKGIDGNVCPHMMGQSAAPPELLNDMVCECHPHACNLDTCSCFGLDRARTAACSCKGRLEGQLV